jgi:hypothetical protein
LALIFGSPNTTQTWLENLGCYIQPFIAANKIKEKLKAKVKTLQEKRIVYEAIKI